MSWSDPIYTCHPDEETARDDAEALGVVFSESGPIPTGNKNFALHAPMQAPWLTPPVFDGKELVTPGVPEPGFWSMLRINLGWEGAEATLAAIETMGVRRTLTEPPVVWL